MMMISHIPPPKHSLKPKKISSPFLVLFEQKEQSDGQLQSKSDSSNTDTSTSSNDESMSILESFFSTDKDLIIQRQLQAKLEKKAKMEAQAAAQREKAAKINQTNEEQEMVTLTEYSSSDSFERAVMPLAIPTVIATKHKKVPKPKIVLPQNHRNIGSKLRKIEQMIVDAQMESERIAQRKKKKRVASFKATLAGSARNDARKSRSPNKRRSRSQSLYQHTAASQGKSRDMTPVMAKKLEQRHENYRSMSKLRKARNRSKSPFRPTKPKAFEFNSERRISRRRSRSIQRTNQIRKQRMNGQIRKQVKSKSKTVKTPKTPKTPAKKKFVPTKPVSPKFRVNNRAQKKQARTKETSKKIHTQSQKQTSQMKHKKQRVSVKSGAIASHRKRSSFPLSLKVNKNNPGFMDQTMASSIREYKVVNDKKNQKQKRINKRRNRSASSNVFERLATPKRQLAKKRNVMNNRLKTRRRGRSPKTQTISVEADLLKDVTNISSSHKLTVSQSIDDRSNTETHFNERMHEEAMQSEEKEEVDDDTIDEMIKEFQDSVKFDNQNQNQLSQENNPNTPKTNIDDKMSIFEDKLKKFDDLIFEISEESHPSSEDKQINTLIQIKELKPLTDEEMFEQMQKMEEMDDLLSTHPIDFLNSL